MVAKNTFALWIVFISVIPTGTSEALFGDILCRVGGCDK
jgi:hypothetical protein